ncbi:hypothetical protein [Dactylosporangium sp. NPDC051541]|uniref:hypothetical protein n=1 Tax=Dactylosporangium sp. NPDC051541 TaxID=3363977 RepID=UPI0037BB12C7
MREVAGLVVGVAGIGLAGVGLHGVLDIGGCVSGGSYEVARACPVGADSLFWMAFGGVILWVAGMLVSARAFFVPGVGQLLWVLGFAGGGVALLVMVHQEEEMPPDARLGAVIVAWTFLPMGLAVGVVGVAQLVRRRLGGGGGGDRWSRGPVASDGRSVAARAGGPARPARPGSSAGPARAGSSVRPPRPGSSARPPVEATSGGSAVEGASDQPAVGGTSAGPAVEATSARSVVEATLARPAVEAAPESVVGRVDVTGDVVPERAGHEGRSGAGGGDRGSRAKALKDLRNIGALSRAEFEVLRGELVRAEADGVAEVVAERVAAVRELARRRQSGAMSGAEFKFRKREVLRAARRPGSGNPWSRLKALHELRSVGALSRAEFEVLRADLVRSEADGTPEAVAERVAAIRDLARRRDSGRLSGAEFEDRKRGVLSA